MNAFTAPAKGIAIRQQSRKQMILNMKRVNREEPACTKNDTEKTKRIEKAAI